MHCFQEVKLTDSNLDKSLALPEGYETFWALSNKRKGMHVKIFQPYARILLIASS